MELSFKYVCEALGSNPDFAGIDLQANSKIITINAQKTALEVYTNSWIEFTTKSAILKISDGFPRYVYYGNFTIGDISFLQFWYRNFLAQSNGSGNNDFVGEILFDSVPSLALGRDQSWFFTGFIIDRGA